MIETRYYCRIDHYFISLENDEKKEKIEDELFSVSLELGLEDFGFLFGSGASYPYIEFWSDSEEVARTAEKRLKEILKLHRIKLYP